MRLAPCVMVQGTASGVGKSLLAAALCRIFARGGYRVAPFKSQNMSLNAAVTADGGEIGRAQAVQAAAAGIEPTVDMNPILLKPETDDRSQVVVRGRAIASLDWRGYGRLAPTLWPVVVESLERLRAAHDLVVIEGAGNPAEINLECDLANMRVAAVAGAPVLLVGDIDRGGVFAALVGTLALLSPDDRARVAGLVVNRFRGDPSVLAPGLELLAARAGVPVLGVVPHLGEAPLPEEDSLGLEDRGDVADALVSVAVARLPRIANFDDLEPLTAEPRVAVRFVTRPEAVDAADVVVLPGSKTTVADLAWLRERGLAAAIARAATDGRAVIGLCGGYQMLGERLDDPDRVESAAPRVSGLGLLPVVTTFAREKTTVRARGRVLAGGPFDAAAGAPVEAYEIHCGRTTAHGGDAVFALTERAGAPTDALDGTRAGTVVGTYLHGCFASGALRRALLTAAASRRGVGPDPRWGAAVLADRYDRLADRVAAALDLEALGRLAHCPLGALAE